MVSVRKKVTKGRSYYYLEHSLKVGRRVETRSKYLGTKIPKNIEIIKSDFLQQIYSEKWFNKFDKIKENYNKEQKKMPNEVKEKFLEDFMVRFTYDSNRIEGSSLNFQENLNLLTRGISPKEKPLSDIKEAESHRKVFYIMLAHKKDLNLQTILFWHKELFGETKTHLAGKIRNYKIIVTGSKTRFPYPAELYVLLREFFKWYEKNKIRLHPVMLAALVHFKFVTIHPFGDGNGRISRLMMNFVLQKHGYPMFNISYKNRKSYYNALERSQTKESENIFLQWFTKRYIKEYKRFLAK